MTRRITAALVVAIAAGTAAVLVVTRLGPAGPSGLRAPPDPATGEMQPRVRDQFAAARRAVAANPSSAAAWGRLGEVCDAHRLFDDARLCYERAAALAPRDHRWPYLLATVLEAGGAGPEDVASHYEAAIDLDPAFTPAWCRLGHARLEQGRAEGARDAFRHAVEIDRDLAAAHRGLGRCALARADARGAIEHLERATALAPADRGAWASLAQAYAQAGDRGRAEQAAQRAQTLAASPDVPDPVRAEVEALGLSPRHCLDRAALLAEAGDHQGVVDNLSIVAEALPDHPLVHLQLGTSYAALGRDEEALRHYERACDLQDDLIDAHLEMAPILIEQGRLTEAIEHLRRALAHAPDDPTVLTWLGAALGRRGDFAAAQTVLERALDLAPSDVATRLNLAGVLLERGKTEQALAQYREAVRIDPLSADAYFRLGLALVSAGRPDEAIESFRQAVAIDPRHPAAHELARLAVKSFTPPKRTRSAGGRGRPRRTDRR